MSQADPLFADHPWFERQRRRFMRPDAHRYLKPDHERWLRPDAHRWNNDRPSGDAMRAFGCDRSSPPEQRGVGLADPQIDDEADHEFTQAVAAYRRSLADLRVELAGLRSLLRSRKTGFNPSQPRVPAGNPDGGEWTGGEGQGARFPDGRIRLAQVGSSITDADGSYKPGGHHEMARGIFGKWKLRSETRRIFNDSTTGKLPRMLIRTSPDGTPIGHFWGQAHMRYNEAIQELGDSFLQRNSVTPEQLTPDHARAIQGEIRESQDPRIRDFNNAMKLIRRLFRLRTGRGTE